MLTWCSSVGTGLPRGQERDPPSERIGPVSQQAALHLKEITWVTCYLSSSAGIAFAVPLFKTAVLPPRQRGFRGQLPSPYTHAGAASGHPVQPAKPITGKRRVI